MLANGTLAVGPNVLDSGECAQISHSTYSGGEFGTECSTTDTIGSASADTIHFSGSFTITLASQLPVLSTGNDTIFTTSDVRVVGGGTSSFDCLSITSSSNTVQGVRFSSCNNAVKISGTATGNSIVSDLLYSNSTGVRITGENADTNLVYGNLIGNDGASAQANGIGVLIEAGADGNNVGGPLGAQRNFISGNTNEGVKIDGASTTSNVVQNNYIGTNSAGTGALGNGTTGVLITNGATGNIVGGTVANSRNVISGNGNWGVGMTGGSTTGNLVEGNYIGTKADGSAAVGNVTGVALWAPGNTVGGNGVAGNLISGNSYAGIEIFSTSGNYVENNRIGLNAAGTAAIPNGNGISIDHASGNHVTISPMGDRNIISGNSGKGIVLTGATASGNDISANYIGTNAAGSAAIANASDGVYITNSAHDNVIGVGNLISGNTGYGVAVDSTGTGNVIKGNYIGTNASGTSALANFMGVIIMIGASGNTVGGSTAGERNVISGNTLFGVSIYSTGSTGNTVKGNYIGTNAAGTGALPNLVGVRIDNGAASNTVGGSSASDRNVIAGNVYGMVLSDAGTTGNTIKGNYIGVDATGSAALANSSDGIEIQAGAQSNTIGGTTSGERNVISGNGSRGIVITSAGTTGNVVAGNYIGTNAAGTATVGNGSAGVLISTSATGNTIGGTATGAGNLISGNSGAGVAVTDASTTGNSIRQDSIYGNGGLGIDLNNDGVTPNDGGDGDTGPNNLQNFPVIGSSSSDGVSTTISGTLDTPNPDTASVDVFSTQPGDPEGRVYLGTATPSAGGAWTLLIMGTPPYGRLTATATKGGSTSEFSSPDVAAPLGPGLPLTTVVRQGDATPLTPTAGTFASFGPAAIPNASGDVVFWASVSSGSASEGIFKNSGGTITTLVAAGDAGTGRRWRHVRHLHAVAAHERFRRCRILGIDQSWFDKLRHLQADCRRRDHQDRRRRGHVSGLEARLTPTSPSARP